MAGGDPGLSSRMGLCRGVELQPRMARDWELTSTVGSGSGQSSSIVAYQGLFPGWGLAGSRCLLAPGFLSLVKLLWFVLGGREGMPLAQLPSCSEKVPALT